MALRFPLTEGPVSEPKCDHTAYKADEISIEDHSLYMENGQLMLLVRVLFLLLGVYILLT